MKEQSEALVKETGDLFHKSLSHHVYHGDNNLQDRRLSQNGLRDRQWRGRRGRRGASRHGRRTMSAVYRLPCLP